MFYYLYEIKNLVNSKIYVGVHKTRNMNDGYMGSGKVIRSAIEKYGIENFQKVILETFNDEKDMYAREKEIVNEDFLSRKDVYNLRRGGTGGFDWINNQGKNLYGHNGIPGYGGENLLDGNELKQRLLAQGRWDEHVDKLSKKARQRYEQGFVNGFKNKKHLEITKRQIGEKTSLAQRGNKNSQFGTRWIYNDALQKSMRIKKTDPVPEGWAVGRKIKFIPQ